MYGGALGQKIVARVQELGGFLTIDDMKKNQPTWVTPISVPFKGYRVWELPPNNQGIATLEMLRILEPYDLKAMGHNSATYLHHLIEAKKLAYADLAQYVGDADHLTIPPSQMLSDEFIAERRSHIDPKHAAQTQVDAGAGAHVERDDLSHGGRQRRQHGVVHQQPVRRIRLGHRRAGHGLRAAGPRRRVHDDGRTAEHRRAGQASVPHADSRVRDEAGPTSAAGRHRRRAVHELRAHGRRDAGAGARAVPASTCSCSA